MAISSQQKGKRYEREIASRFNKFFGCNIRRTPNSGGLWMKGDLVCLTGELARFVFECKHQETLNIWKCLEQTQRQAGSKEGVLVFKRNRSTDYVVMELTDWMNIVKELMDVKAVVACNSHGSVEDAGMGRQGRSPARSVGEGHENS